MTDPAGENDARLAVPRFSSFRAEKPEVHARPKAKEPRSRHADKDAPTKSPARHARHRDSRRDHHGLDGSHSRRRHRRRSPSRRKSRDAPQPPEASPEGTSSPVFIVDTEGDRFISRYGGVDRSQIPSYYRHGSGRVLGTQGRLVLHRDGPRDQFSLRYPGEGPSILGKGGLRSESVYLRGQPIRVRPRIKRDDLGAEDHDSGYLSVGGSKRRKLGHVDSESSADEGPSYRSIEGRAKAEAFQDESDEQTSEDGEAVDLSEANPLKWKTIQLNGRVKEHPGDIDAWLELVDHQDLLQRAEASLDERAAASVARSFSEIKVSMLESALSNASAAQDRARLLVRLMREGAKVWSSNMAARRWLELSAEEAGDFELWRAHVDFEMSSVTTIQFDRVKSMLVERLKGAAHVSGLQPNVDTSEAIYVFLRAMRFIHDSGYKELAVAAWQALLEINFLRPISSQTEDRDNMASFRDFWESELPRLGDADAQGWRRYATTSGPTEAPEPVAQEPLEQISTGDVYKAWGHSERCHSERAGRPARTMDDGTEDDPFRVVMFSDIEPWLFAIPESEVKGEVGGELIDAFLVFCGLPPAFRASKWTELAVSDQFTFRSAPVGTGVRNEMPHDADGHVQRATPEFDVGNANVAMSASLLFPGTSWFRYFSSHTKHLAVDAAQILRTLGQLVHLADVGALSVYYLGFAHGQDASMVKKVAKALLKKYPNAADVYNAYALAEMAAGNREIAVKLFKSSSWMELQTGRKNHAVWRLCSAFDNGGQHAGHDVDTESVSPTVVLKTRQALSSRIQECFYQGKICDAGIYIEGLVLLAYLTVGGCTEPASEAQGNISAAVDVLGNMSAEFESHGYGHSSSHERVLQFGANVLYLNAQRGPFRRQFLRDTLSAFLEPFPQNTMFLALAEWADSGLRVVDETRQLLRERILVEGRDSISGRIFSVTHEMKRGNASSTGAAFEHALSSEVCKFNAGLWASYVDFCTANKQLRGRAKDVFYKAVRHCPWSKEVLMGAFGALIRDMESDELRSVYNTMTGKGLRVHVDLEDRKADILGAASMPSDASLSVHLGGNPGSSLPRIIGFTQLSRSDSFLASSGLVLERCSELDDCAERQW
ncbi:hypothetical protein UVI_02024770 [Ustilaginoidea virens]|uniref:DUF1740-domain-containing protein n=1 Tax=Ustilaginoidea virens TaxID=1159556 RepID=A0A1B5KQZ4_USTVR|nr:hypothetical protein UVI_02024770 [Ustilaginoidea virens]